MTEKSTLTRRLEKNGNNTHRGYLVFVAQNKKFKKWTTVYERVIIKFILVYVYVKGETF
jgi:hypothetical protein